MEASALQASGRRFDPCHAHNPPHRIEVVGIVGTYTDLRHVIAYDDGEVRQQFAVCFEARVIGGSLLTDGSEAKDSRLFAADELYGLNIHPSTRLRVQHYSDARPAPYNG